MSANAPLPNPLLFSGWNTMSREWEKGAKRIRDVLAGKRRFFTKERLPYIIGGGVVLVAVVAVIVAKNRKER